MRRRLSVVEKVAPGLQGFRPPAPQLGQFEIRTSSGAKARPARSMQSTVLSNGSVVFRSISFWTGTYLLQAYHTMLDSKMARKNGRYFICGISILAGSSWSTRSSARSCCPVASGSADYDPQSDGPELPSRNVILLRIVSATTGRAIEAFTSFTLPPW